MTEAYSGSQATTAWIGSDGTITNHDPDTEMGFWVRLFHNECDRSAHLEREIERLQAVNRRYKTALGMLWDLIDLNEVSLPLYPEFEQFVKEAHDYYVAKVLSEGGNP